MRSHRFGHYSEQLREFSARRLAEGVGAAMLVSAGAMTLALVSWSAHDPSLNHATGGHVRNLLGHPGAVAADLLMQLIGFGAIAAIVPLAVQGLRMIKRRRIERAALRLGLWVAGIFATAATASLLPPTDRWPLPSGLGGVAGDAILAVPRAIFAGSGIIMAIFGLAAAFVAILSVSGAAGLGFESANDIRDAALEEDYENERPAYGDDDDDRAGEPGFALISLGALIHLWLTLKSWGVRLFGRLRFPKAAPKAETAPQAHPRREPIFDNVDDYMAFAPRRARNLDEDAEDEAPAPARAPHGPAANAPPQAPARRVTRQPMRQQAPVAPEIYEYPDLELLAPPKKSGGGVQISEDILESNARVLEGVLEDFSVRGEIINVRPGPVVTLYELEPAPGIKSSRVIGLADDIARSMSAVSARVAVVPGRNAIGIELPNQKRETVYLRELVASEDFIHSNHKLAIALGKTIGGEPVIVDLARMPHLLVAGTTGSGKSVAINTMILSLLYRLKPEECRLIMVDPKMLELSVYDNIPHLLTPVVTDPKKAVVALKWAVREMEDRYKKMSKVGVRNIDGYNARVAEAQKRGETITRTVQTGFDRETGEAIFEHEEMDLSALPYIVVIVDEMADLMLVAGKDIEGAIQRLAQMARAAGIHLIMATQRPSVDVITGTIKANFPTRISFQVTSKIDSRTILGEQGAEQLLGQGDMLYMAGGGRISRVHGPFVSDGEVEHVVAHLKAQGAPQYLDNITSEDEEGGDEGDAPAPGSMDAEEGGDLYDRAVNIVLRDKKCSTSYIQRRLSVGYNKAASLVERMEKEGVVSAPNHAGKREILVGGGVDRGAFDIEAAE
ncbi:DNA translocase FtsK [Methylocystis parvus]|uniref:DNA translocase FtsK n=1 Tax=Methylocystis parvus TaxID=134 RepID=A0A6B8M9T2_9HYPH|nr:DNA translocase FtsK [Methylocystis parvus]QGM98582.1 cell division protein FtsK [Methylocystis parvus]WBK01075.1 DNA translocase FtsK 4TM domain-containing protein [Methylocystis parvus OBBP]